MKKKLWPDFSWIVFFILLFIFLKLSVFGFYLIPSDSMLPNLLPGDRVVANKLAYGLTLPFVSEPVFQWSTPQRGDIIIFSFSNESNTYIKRVIGLPGDLIAFHEGVVSVNGEPLNLHRLSAKQTSDLNLSLYQEQNANLLKSPHAIYLSKEPAQTFFESRRFLVPPEKVFVLGDNRDNSADSRVNGYVDVRQIYGRVPLVLFSTTGESFFPKFRKVRTLLNISDTVKQF